MELNYRKESETENSRPKRVLRVKLQDFAARCADLVAAKNASDGILACEQLLAHGARGRLRAAALRYKALFTLMGSEGWAGRMRLIHKLSLFQMFLINRGEVSA